MVKFHFRLAPVLALRENARDLQRQELADALRAELELREQRLALEHEHAVVLDEMRRLGRGGRMQVDSATSRRVYAGQLILAIIQAERNRAAAETHVERCREALVVADQQVQILEKLREKQLAEYQSNQERRTAREMEEAWQAAHAGEYRA